MKERVTTVVIDNDTLIQFKLSDAKLILADIIEKEYLDSLITAYQVNDSLKDISIGIQYSVISDLKEKNATQLKIIDNMIIIDIDKDKEISLLNKIIKAQKKEIRKQKIYKIIGFTAAVALPIIVLIITH